MYNNKRVIRQEERYHKGDRITFHAPVPWLKGEYKIVTDVIVCVYPNFLFTRKRYCVKPFDVRGREGGRKENVS